ncbi:MAG: LysE family transporter [Bacteroidaceae bacterium]|nr:LysE family transporter [Bacteroidaceae bacterium]
MFSIEPTHVLDLIIKGLLVGIIASAPMGPIGVLVVRRTLVKGRAYGFVTGLGAALSDIIYALMTGIGMSFVMTFLEKETSVFWLKVLGSIVLFVFGLHAFRNKVKEMPGGSSNKGTLWHNALTGFLLTVSNPLIVFLFIGLFARFDFISGTNYFEQVIGYTMVFAGALLWWICLTTAINTVRQRFNTSYVELFNRLLGLLVMAASLIGLIYTLLFKLCL